MSTTSLVTCHRHPSVAADTRCLICGTALCHECAVVIDARSFCAEDAGDLQLLRDQRPPLELPRPDIATRGLAYIMDGAIVFGIGAFMLSIVMLLLRPAVSFDVAILVHVALFTAALAIYSTYFIAHHGQTPGQALFHLRVVGLEGTTINIGRAFLRWIGYLLSSLTLSYGFLVAAKDRLGRGWPDRFAGTVVIGPALAPSEKLRAAGWLFLILVAEALYAIFTLSVR